MQTPKSQEGVIYSDRHLRVIAEPLRSCNTKTTSISFRKCAAEESKWIMQKRVVKRLIDQTSDQD